MEEKGQRSFKGRLFNWENLILSSLVVSFLALTGVLLYLLFQSRTPIARTIWAYFDASNLIVYLAMTFILLILILMRKKPHVTISLTIVHSVVSHVFKQIVFASRFGYDTWISLGWSVYIFRGEFYPKNPLYPIPFTVYAEWPLLSKIYHVTERINLYSLSVVSAQIFSVDVYWTHLLLVPLLWSIFIPILIYKISKLLFKEETVSLLAALLLSSVPSLIIWGSITVSFGLACIFLLLNIYLSLSYLRFKRGLLISIIIAFTTFLTHELIGILSVSVILLAHAYETIGGIKQKHLRRASLFIEFIFAVFLIPFTLIAFGLFVNPRSRPSFTLDKFGYITYETFFALIFGRFSEMMFIDVLVHGIVPFLGIISLIYMILEDASEESRKMNVFMLLYLSLLMIDYRLLKFFMVKIPFSVERLWVFRDLLAVPFAAIAVGKTTNFLVNKLTSGKIALETTVLRKNPVNSVLSTGLREVAIVLIIVLSISSLSTAAIYWAYPQSTEAWWTTAYELDAARYIEENTPRNVTYAVVTDVHARLAGYAVVGPQNPRAYYYGPYESYLLKPLYQELVDNPSMGPILTAREKNNASVVYVIVNTRRAEVKDGERTISQIMDLPYSELFGVFGEEVYVFKIRPPTERTITEIGPSVFLYSNNTHVNTTFALDVVTYEAVYNVTLVGLSNYNITEWPTHWSFESITPEPDKKQVDANNWINFTGREDVAYTVVWKANVIYQPVGWKDDSFKIDKDWRLSSSVHWEQPPQISTDGDILKMTGIFKKGVREGYKLSRDVANISTDEYPYVIVKWRSTSTVAIVTVTYDDDSNFYPLKPEATYPYAQSSDNDWLVSIVKLPTGKTIKEVSVALDDYPPWTDVEGTHSVYYDYIMFSNVTTPQF